MLTSELKAKIDAIWGAFWTNGIANPLEAIEQFTYLLFLRRLSDEQNRRERIALQEEVFVENPIFREDEKRLQWKNWPADDRALYELVDREVFPWLRNIGGGQTSFANNLKDARLTIPSSALLKDVVNRIDDLEDHARRLAAQGESYLDTMGDLYEYLLNKLAQAGRNGQFRTPRHLIEMMVELVAPTPKSIICDPACGTAGFLANTARYLQKHHKDAYLDGANLYHFNNEAFIGTDLDATMVRIAAMNLHLHGVENPGIKRANALATEFAFESEICDIILANPPFAGSVNETELSPNLKSATGGSKKTELLFLALFLRLLKPGGRAAVIVPDGVLFGAQKAHQTVRTELVEKHKLEAVISMPSGVFRPYAGVSTAILVFTKTGAGGTDEVWFYDMHADGFSLDDKRNPVPENDIPDVLKKWPTRADEGRTGQAFLVPKTEIAANGYDLSLNRYKTVVYEAQTHRPPLELIAEIRTLESQLSEGLEQLESMFEMSWPMVKLGDISRLITKGTTPTTLGYAFQPEGIPFLRVQNIQDGRVELDSALFIDETTDEILRRSRIYPHDLLISIAGTIGRCALVDASARPMNCNQAVAITRLTDEVNRRYILRWLETDEAQRRMAGAQVTGTISNLSLTQISNLQIPLPPIEEQKRIARILDAADALRLVRRESLARLDELGKSLFLEFFGDPATNSKNWEKRKFADIGKSRLGKMLDARKQTGNHLRLYLRNANVQWHRIDLSSVFEMDFDEKDRKTFRLHPGDLLICEGGEPGRAAIWRGEISEIYYQKALHRVQVNTDVATSQYLVYLLERMSKSGRLADQITAATIAHLTGEKLATVEIPVPPLALQQAFAQQIEELEAIKTRARTQLVELDALFASIQERAFSGQL